MVKKEIILERFQKCNEYLKQLEKIVADIEYEEFNNNPLLYGSAERILHRNFEIIFELSLT